MKTTKDLKKGDTVYVARPGNYDVHYAKATMTKVTPSGQVNVSYGEHDKTGKRFRADGYEVGAANRYRAASLELDTEKVEGILDVRSRVSDAAQALQRLEDFAKSADCRATSKSWAMATAEKLEQLVADFRAAAEAI